MGAVRSTNKWIQVRDLAGTDHVRGNCVSIGELEVEIFASSHGGRADARGARIERGAE